MTDQFSRKGKEIASVRLSVCLSVCLSGSSSTSTLEGSEGYRGSEEGQLQKKIVGYKYKYAVFNIKPTYNSKKFTPQGLNYIHQNYIWVEAVGARPLTGGVPFVPPLEPPLWSVCLSVCNFGGL